MDWAAAIGRHHAALRQVVAVLLAMVGAGIDPDTDAAALAEDRPTLARHRHRALLRLVRPAEAAARRLVIALALAVTTPAPTDPGGGDRPQPGTPIPPGRPRRLYQPLQPTPSPAILRDGTGTGIVLPRPARQTPTTGARAQAPVTMPAWATVSEDANPPRILRLPLTDPARRLRVRRVALRDLPRISVPGVIEPMRAPRRPLPTPQDRLDASRLVLRIRALASALDDLPREARRFRRWQARHASDILRARSAEDALVERSDADAASIPRAAGGRPAGIPRRFRRLSPLRSGRPPGGRRIPIHEVHAILTEAHDLAFRALQLHDTS